MDDEYISRNEHNAFASDVDHEQTRQNKRIEALEVTVRQINDLTLSVQKLAINMEHMLVNQTEQNKRLEELENRDGEKWRSISMYVLTAVVGAVIGFVLKQAGTIRRRDKMKELFEQNKVLFLAVITALIIVFLVKKLIDYITKKGLEGIRLDVYKLFVEAEKTFRASKQGQQKFDYVIHMARGLLPKPIQLFVSESMLKEAVQLWFDSIKDLLDDGKLNNSVYDLEDVEEVSREDKINHTTELDDGTWTNYAETPLPETDLEDPEEQEQTEDNQAAAEQEV